MKTKIGHIKNHEKKIFQLNEQVYELLSQVRFLNRQNNILKAKLLTWENKKRDDSSSKVSVRSYANLRVKSMKNKHPEVEWNNNASFSVR